MQPFLEVVDAARDGSMIGSYIVLWLLCLDVVVAAVGFACVRGHVCSPAVAMVTTAELAPCLLVRCA